MDPAQRTKSTCIWDDEEIMEMAVELMRNHAPARTVIHGVLLHLEETSRGYQKAFFSSCKALDLRERKLWSAYVFSARKCDTLISNVLNGNALMIEHVKHKEKEYRSHPPKYAP